MLAKKRRWLLSAGVFQVSISGIAACKWTLFLARSNSDIYRVISVSEVFPFRPFNPVEKRAILMTGEFEINRYFIGLFVSRHRWQNVLQRNGSQHSPRYQYHQTMSFVFFSANITAMECAFYFFVVCLVFNRVRLNTSASKSLMY